MTLPKLSDYISCEGDLRCPGGGRSFGRRDQVESRGLVTIITVAFNSAATIGRTIDSICAQTYGRIEYVVVDGGSIDGTVDLLRQRSDSIDLWVSEKDRGISDGFNRGIALARGNLVALVNSDDWLEPQHIERAVAAMVKTGADFVFGDVMVHNADGSPRYLLAGDPNYGARVRHSMPDINHPSVLCTRDVYQRHGLYDPQFRVAMDYEWLLRGYRAGVRGCYAEGLTSHMDGRGVSQRNLYLALGEIREISIRYGYPAAFAWPRFIGRLGRVTARRAMERSMPEQFSHRMRALLHRGYRGWQQ